MRGMGTARAAALVAAGELARRLASQTIDRGVPVTSSQMIHRDFGPLLADEMRELF